MSKLGVTERRACLVLGQHRSTQRKIPTRPDDEAALTADIVALAVQYGRYGYRRIAALLRSAGWSVNLIPRPSAPDSCRVLLGART
ncbi:hypothetical protein GCM10019059_45420 [Camelimonas fluminis]|nr:hypothetical protein GCM10019059_45420 [Camelimonas fluminis]